MVMTMVIDKAALMKTVKASEFKAKCLRLMEEVARSGNPVVITKNGRPIAQLSPLVSRPASLCGAHKGKIAIKGNVVDPIDETWDAAS